jgi:hypothetical protein
VEIRLAREHLAVSGNDRRDIEERHRAKRADPLVRIAAESVGDRMVEKVAGNQYLFGRQIGHDVAAGVAPAQKSELHFAVAEIDVERVVER